MTDKELQDLVIWALRDGWPLSLTRLCIEVGEPRKDTVKAAVRAVGGLVYQEGPPKWMATLNIEGCLRQRRVIEEMEQAALRARWAVMEAISAGLSLYDDGTRRAVLAAVGGPSLGGGIGAVIADGVMAEMAVYRDVGIDEDGEVFLLVP